VVAGAQEPLSPLVEQAQSLPPGVPERFQCGVAPPVRARFG
jgi:hypothetical protein